MSARIWAEVPEEVAAEPGRVADRHVSFLFEAEQRGGHVYVKVRAASRHPSCQVNHSRGLCGELVMAPDEWLLFRCALEAAPTPGPTWILHPGPGSAPRSAVLVAGAGHEALADVEADHDAQRFLEFSP